MKISVSAILVATFVCGSFAHSDSGLSLNSRDALSRFRTLAASVRGSINLCNTTINEVTNNINKLVSIAQTDELQDAGASIKLIARQFSDNAMQLMGTLTSIVTDRTVPIAELFRRFATVYRKWKTFMKTECLVIVASLNTTLGCSRSHKFDTTIQDVFRQVTQIAQIVRRVERIVLNPEDVHLLAKYASGSPDSPNLLPGLVDALSKSVGELRNKISVFATMIDQTVSNIETSNNFLSRLNGTELTIRTQLNTSEQSIYTASRIQLTTALSKYQSAHRTIKTDLSNALQSLNIFAGSRKLAFLVDEQNEAYNHLYQFLEKHSGSDMKDIGSFYYQIGNNTVEVVNKTAEIFFNAVYRTALKLTDIVLERSSNSDSCFSSFSPRLSLPYHSLNSLVSTCVSKETSRWAAISDGIDAMMKLVQANSQELSNSLARCASYVSFATSSADFVQAKACLKTNLEDLRQIPYVLTPQLQNIDDLVAKEVRASKFRMENCLATKLHEMIATLKNLRTTMDICAGRFDDCARKNRDDDNMEWYYRDRNENHGDGGQYGYGSGSTGTGGGSSSGPWGSYGSGSGSGSSSTGSNGGYGSAAGSWGNSGSGSSSGSGSTSTGSNGDYGSSSGSWGNSGSGSSSGSGHSGSGSGHSGSGSGHSGSGSGHSGSGSGHSGSGTGSTSTGSNSGYGSASGSWGNSGSGSSSGSNGDYGSSSGSSGNGSGSGSTNTGSNGGYGSASGSWGNSGSGSTNTGSSGSSYGSGQSSSGSGTGSSGSSSGSGHNGSGSGHNGSGSGHNGSGSGHNGSGSGHNGSGSGHNGSGSGSTSTGSNGDYDNTWDSWGNSGSNGGAGSGSTNTGGSGSSYGTGQSGSGSTGSNGGSASWGSYGSDAGSNGSSSGSGQSGYGSAWSNETN